MRIHVPRDEIISLMEKTAVLHPEHLYNVMEHHYMKWWGLLIILSYTKLNCTYWYCGLNFYMLCMLIHTATLYSTFTRTKTVDKTVWIFCLHKMLDTSSDSVATFLLKICSLSTHGDYPLTVSIIRGSDYISLCTISRLCGHCVIV